MTRKIAALLLTLILAGCGGGGGTPASNLTGSWSVYQIEIDEVEYGWNYNQSTTAVFDGDRLLSWAIGGQDISTADAVRARFAGMWDVPVTVTGFTNSGGHYHFRADWSYPGIGEIYRMTTYKFDLSGETLVATIDDYQVEDGVEVYLNRGTAWLSKN